MTTRSARAALAAAWLATWIALEPETSRAASPPDASPPDASPPDASPPDASPTNAPVRIFGLGSAGGGGFGAVSLTGQATTSTTGSAVLGVLILPTLEARVFFSRREYSLDLSVPILNAIAVSVINRGFFFNADLFFAFNVGGDVRFVAGPGLGCSVASVNHTLGAALRIPAEIGVEVLLFRRHLGIALLARPWVEFAGGSTQQAVGGGLVGVISVSGYAVRRPAAR